MKDLLCLADWFAREGGEGQWREKNMAGLAGVSTVRLIRSGFVKICI